MKTSASPSVLIVEDERLVAKDLQQSLGHMGYDAFAIAASAEEAVACAARKWPDVVLMDIRIKGPNDGIETAAILKKKFPVIVIYLTAHADEAMLDRAKRTAPDGYLLKPVKDAELHSMIEIALNRRELDAEREKSRVIEHRLFKITDNVPIAIAYFDLKGQVQFANPVFRSLVPYDDDPIGISAITFLGEPLYRQSYASRQRAMLGEEARCVVTLAGRQYEVTYLPDHDAGGAVIGVYALGYDVTIHEQLTADLRQANSDLETILNAVPANITSWRTDLTNRFANEAACARFGLVRGASTGQSLRQVMGEEQYLRAKPLIDRALAGQPSTHEHSEAGADGSVRYGHYYYIPERKAGAVVGLYILTYDITELRRSHEKIRRLAQRLETVREEERRALAVILHDGIAQDLFAMKLGLDHLTARTKGSTAIHTMSKEIGAAVARCMEDVRQIAVDLRPIALAYGTTAVISEHARRFAERSGLVIRVRESADIAQLDEATQLLLFRAVQEALTNVARHAHATEVDITLSADGEKITVDIVDNGTGILDGAMNKPHSLGLLGLRERFTALGGGMQIARHAPQGTVLTLYLPQHRDELRAAPWSIPA